MSLATAAAQSGPHYGTLADLVTSTEEAQAAGRLHAQLKSLMHPAVLVVNEVGDLPITRTGAMPIVQRMTRPYAHASTVLTPNDISLGRDRWRREHDHRPH